MGYTSIEWPEYTWNPVWGCKRRCKTPAGEVYCYAWGINTNHPNPNVPDNFEPTLMKAIDAEIPKSVKCIFVNSMSDVCYWQPEWLERVIARIKGYPDKYFVFLTKDYEFYRKNIHLMNLPNVMLGLTATNESQYAEVTAEFWRMKSEIESAGSKPAHTTACQSMLQAKLMLNIEPMFYPPPQLLYELPWEWVIVGPLNKNGRSKFIPKEWIEPIIKFNQEQKLYPLFLKNGFRHMHSLYDNIIQDKPEYCKKLKIENGELKMQTQAVVPVLREADQITLFDNARDFQD